MAKTISIDEEVMAVLKKSVVTATRVTLSGELLPRGLYERVDKVLKAAGGKWSKKARAHVFKDDPRWQLGLAIKGGGIENRQQAYGIFYTPSSLADQVAEMAEIHKGHRVLEPSAGEGALANAVRSYTPFISCVEVRPEAVVKLRAAGFECAEFNFLELDPESLPGRTRFERVVMNPPFADGADIRHVMHAMKFLKPGGLLVSIMSAGWTFNGGKQAAAFREFVAQNGRFAMLPEGLFKEAGTGIRTTIVSLIKND